MQESKQPYFSTGLFVSVLDQIQSSILENMFKSVATKNSNGNEVRGERWSAGGLKGTLCKRSFKRVKLCNCWKERGFPSLYTLLTCLEEHRLLSLILKYLILRESLRNYAYVMIIFYPMLKCSPSLGWNTVTVKKGLSALQGLYVSVLINPSCHFTVRKVKFYAPCITRKDRQCICNACKTDRIPHSDKMRIWQDKLMKIK